MTLYPNKLRLLTETLANLAQGRRGLKLIARELPPESEAKCTLGIASDQLGVMIQEIQERLSSTPHDEMTSNATPVTDALRRELACLSLGLLRLCREFLRRKGVREMNGIENKLGRVNGNSWSFGSLRVRSGQAKWTELADGDN